MDGSCLAYERNVKLSHAPHGNTFRPCSIMLLRTRACRFHEILVFIIKGSGKDVIGKERALPAYASFQNHPS
jgi:hypothetical protein